MIPKLFRSVIGRDFLPVLLTLISAAIVACIEGQLGASLVVLLLLTGGLQTFLQAYASVYERLVPIEGLNKKNSVQREPLYRVLVLGLSAVPLFALLSELLCWAIWGAAVVFCCPDALRLVRRTLRRRSAITTTLGMIKDSDAKVAVYMSGLANVAYQVNQWIPVLEELGIPVIIIVRQRGIYAGMSPTNIPVVYVRNAAHLEQVLNCGIETLLYPANPMHNVQALRHYQLNHYFINHGESDKAVNQNQLLLAYDKLLVAGPLAHRRLLEAGLKLREGQVEYVGRPQVELGLIRAESEVTQPVRRILYAPTWEGFVDNVNYSSVNELGLQVLKQLVAQGKYDIVFKPHPYTGARKAAQKAHLQKIKKFCRQHGIAVNESLNSIHECMNNSDLLITDISSVLNDYLVTRKPIILCVNEWMTALDLPSEFPSSRAAYSVAAGSDVGKLIDDINERDTLRQMREDVRKDSLGDFSEGSMDRFRSVIRQSLNHAQ